MALFSFRDCQEPCISPLHVCEKVNVGGIDNGYLTYIFSKQEEISTFLASLALKGEYGDDLYWGVPKKKRKY